MLISLIVAISENRVIGKDNKLPWHLPDDLRFFKETTTNHPIIMGRKNFESIGKVLPGRTNIVLTRKANYIEESATLKIAHSLKESFEIAKIAAEKHFVDECFVIGGAQIYKEALPFCKKLYITRVHQIIDGNVYMPEFEHKFKQVSCVKHFKDEKNIYDFDFETWE